MFSPWLVAEELPLWEAGGGAAFLVTPHYLGANQENTFLLPLPYFIYRGDLIRADRSGVRSFIYDSDNLDINLSFGGSLPVNSEDNNTRQGMDNLDLLAEIGPTLQYSLFKTDQQLLRLDFPVRGAFLLGSKFLNHQGWTANPRLYYSATVNEWDITTTLGPVYSDRRYHGYFYNVQQKDVTVNRNLFQSREGLTGNHFSLSVSRRWGGIFFGGALQYYDLNGAANEDSPLIKQDDYLSASLFMSWVITQSDVYVGK